MTDYVLKENGRTPDGSVNNDLFADGRLIGSTDYTATQQYIREHMKPGDTYQEQPEPPAGKTYKFSYGDMVLNWERENLFSSYNMDDWLKASENNKARWRALEMAGAAKF